MSTSFLTNATIAVAAGFVAVASQSFPPATTSWIAFGIAIGTLAVACLAQADRSRSVIQRSLDGILAIVSAWTIVASVVFEGTTVTWLSLAAAVALVVVAFTGLTCHEMREHRTTDAVSGASMGESLRPAA